MYIVGHRGAAGLAPENTLLAIKAAIAAGVDAVEFDVRTTSDGELVVCHDASLERTYGINKKVKELTKDNIAEIKSQRGDPLPTLHDVLTITPTTPVIIECKGSKWAKPLEKLLSSQQRKDMTVISFNHQELHEFKTLMPEIPCLILEQRNPFDAINAARIYGFDGIDISFWILNPFVHWLARRHKLKVVVYNVNKSWLAAVLGVLYPQTRVTTDYPNKMQYLRPKKLRKPHKNWLGI